MKVVIPHDVFFFDEAIAAMQSVASVVLVHDRSREALLDALADAGAVALGPGTFFGRDVFEAAPKLKLVARIGVGVDRIDLAAATERGVYVTNNPALTADTVAEFTIALLLGIAKNIPGSDVAVKAGRWVEGKRLTTYGNIELCGKTHGVVGMGEIGSRVAAVCRALDMRVLYHKRTRNLQLERLLGLEYADFDTLVRESDTISLHTPLTDETRGLFGAAQFAAMKKSAFLVNQSRGLVVDERALLAALKAGEIAGYATDVFDHEPPDPDSELMRLPNVIVAPHVGGLSREAGLRYSMNIADAVKAVARGDVPDNLVNRDILARR